MEEAQVYKYSTVHVQIQGHKYTNTVQYMYKYKYTIIQIQYSACTNKNTQVYKYSTDI